MLALGETIAAAGDARLVDAAMALFGRALPAAGQLGSPRAQASIALACAAVSGSSAVMSSGADVDAALGFDSTVVMRRLATGLHARFREYARPGWPWPEDTLTYENALLPRALIVAGHRLRADVMLRIGLQVLDWLIVIQTAPQGHLSPIGNGWWSRRGTKSQFDQQPIEATALLLAAEAAHRATGEPRYLAAMERSYAWFLGSNDLRRRIAHPARGAASDGLTPDGVNANEGAESTLMWLMAAEHIRAMRGGTIRATQTSAPTLASSASVTGVTGASGGRGMPPTFGVQLATPIR
jgi:hypothetical protein